MVQLIDWSFELQYQMEIFFHLRMKWTLVSATRALVPTFCFGKPGAKQVQLVFHEVGGEALGELFPVHALPGEAVPLWFVRFTWESSDRARHVHIF